MSNSPTGQQTKPNQTKHHLPHESYRGAATRACSATNGCWSPAAHSRLVKTTINVSMNGSHRCVGCGLRSQHGPCMRRSISSVSSAFVWQPNTAVNVLGWRVQNVSATSSGQRTNGGHKCLQSCHVSADNGPPHPPAMVYVAFHQFAFGQHGQVARELDHQPVGGFARHVVSLKRIRALLCSNAHA